MLFPDNLFQNRQLVIGTKHAKEKVMAPLLERSLGVTCFVAENLNTDILGTFTGEIERLNVPITTLRNKCLLAMEQHNCDLGIASEGSFGSHPSIFFAPANEELVMLIDRKNDLEITARELSTQTNFKGREITSETDLIEFAHSVLFPSHALILRQAKSGNARIIKGITDWQHLINSYNALITEFGTAYAETDMRAMHNPSRMQVIAEATKKLIAKIQSCCPGCHTPGFGIKGINPGLPCSRCGSPTQSTLSHIYSCIKCNYTTEKKFPHKKTTEEPTYCQECNP